MVSRSKLVLAALFIFLLAQDASLVYGAWWQNNDASMPGQTVFIKDEKYKIGGNDQTISFYESQLSVEAIKDFYRKKLLSAGWKEFNPAQELAEMPEAAQALSTPRVTGVSVVFEKGEEKIVLQFMPWGNKGGKVRYGLMRGIIADTTNQAVDAMDMMPKLVAKPKKDIMPIYPGAALTMLAEQPTSMRAAYVVKQDLDPVAVFYRQKMLDYGWELEMEEAPEEVVYNPEKIADVCPTCPKDSSSKMPFKTRYVSMRFGNAAGDVCRLTISNMATLKDGANLPFNLSTIMVTYVEKKK